MANHGAALVLITPGADHNGALGYGFSSITVPLALLFLSNRTLNPALSVLLEVAERVRRCGQIARRCRPCGGVSCR